MGRPRLLDARGDARHLQVCEASRLPPVVSDVLEQQPREARDEREEISDFMQNLGFARVRDTNLFFDFNRDLVVGDAHPGNFLRNNDGQIFAIDVLPAKATGKLLAYAIGF